MTTSGANRGPIGIFDSGVGGLSVWKEVAQLLPQEELIYFADTARCPYGGRSREEIVSFAQEVTEFLIGEKCKALVVASNTITSAAIDRLRQRYDLPFIGIEPAVKPAAARTKTGHIGILATEFTLSSERYEKLLEAYAGNVQIHYQVGVGLVEIVESGRENSPQAEKLLGKYLGEMKRYGVDQLILGCTHYPFLRPQIIRIMGEGITIHDPAEAVARQARQVLDQKGLNAPERYRILSHRFICSGDPERLNRRIEIFGFGDKGRTQRIGGRYWEWIVRQETSAESSRCFPSEKNEK